MSFRVLVADSMAKDGLDALEAASHLEVDNRAGIEPDELAKVLGDYDALIVRSRTKVKADLIAAGKKLKVIGRAGIGVDNVDLIAATRAGVIVMNTPEGNATTTAEHTLSLIFSMARMTPQATASMKAGKWEKKKFMGRELCRKTLGVIGLGNIGRIVADRAQGLRMKVVGYDPYFDAEAAAELGIERVELNELLRRADIITVHVPVNDETRGLIGAAEIDAMKQGVMLVNCARGGIYDEEALLAGLDSGRVAAAALDVYAQEPPPGDHPLVQHERVVCTPHVGASTAEAQVAVAVAIAEQIAAFAEGEAPRNTVNLPSISAGDFNVVGPFMDLAERMGSFCGQLEPESVRSISVEVHGEIGERPTGPIVSSAVAGALKHAFSRANTVNARVLAEERGIKVLESHTTRSEKVFANYVRVTVEGKETHTVAGTIFEGKEGGRFVEVDGRHLEAVPQGCVLVIENRDTPGVIGRIGTVLGKAGINIARMQLSPDKGSGKALSLVSVGQEVSPDVVTELQSGDILDVRQVHL